MLDNVSKINIFLLDFLQTTANKEEFVEDTSLRTATYIDIREDSSTGSTHKLPLEASYARSLFYF